MRNFFTLIVLLSSFIVLNGCKKKDVPKPSSSKSITSFILNTTDNQGVIFHDVVGKITNDSITLKVPIGTNISSLVPRVSISGTRVVPTNKMAQNFSSPVRYTVTAEDGSTAVYIVSISFLSNEKNIISFEFKTSNNSSLLADVVASISGDTISAYIPPSTDPAHLIPSITHNGQSISPNNNLTQDFTSSVQYEVTAEDGSTKKYTVMVTANSIVYVGSKDGYLYALNAATGIIKWKFNTGAAVSSQALSNGIVYTGSTHGTLYALDAATGIENWHYTAASGTSNTFNIPSIHNSMVYFYLNQSSGNYFYALDESSGTLVWKSFVGGMSYLKPSVVGQKIYYCNDDGIYTCNALTGAAGWHYSAGLTFVNPVIVSGNVYAGTEGTVITSVTQSGGSKNWAFIDPEFIGVKSSSPTISGDVIYTGTTYALYAINLTNGELKWRYKLLSSGNEPFSSPIVADGTLYTALYNQLYAFNINDGSIKWKIDNAAGNPVIANNVLFTGSSDGNLYAWNAKTGALKWSFQAADIISSYPCVADVGGTIFYCGDSGDQN